MRLYRIDKIVQRTEGQPFWMPFGVWKWFLLAFLFLVSLLLFMFLFTFPFVRTETPEPVVHEGDVEVLLCWSTADDLDLHCKDPGGEVINFQKKTSSSGGKLDVDMNVNGGIDGKKSMEHIYWPVGGAPAGEYRVWVKLFSSHSAYGKSDYTVTVKANGRKYTYSGVLREEGCTDEVCVFVSVR